MYPLQWTGSIIIIDYIDSISSSIGSSSILTSQAIADAMYAGLDSLP